MLSLPCSSARFSALVPCLECREELVGAGAGCVLEGVREEASMVRAAVGGGGGGCELSAVGKEEAVGEVYCRGRRAGGGEDVRSNLLKN